MRVLAVYPNPTNHTTDTHVVLTPTELGRVAPPARLQVTLTPDTRYNPNWTIALGHAVQRGVSILTTFKEDA